MIIEKSNITVSGQYKAVITRANGIIEELPWFDNLITDHGLNALGQDDKYAILKCHVGTGNSTPNINQIALDALIATENITEYTSVNLGSPTYAGEFVHKTVFAQGSVVGNITEVGVGGLTPDELFSRALFKDTNGDPVSLTLTAIDQLTLYYKITLTQDLTEKTGSFIISGVTYNYTMRPSYCAYLGSYSPIFQTGASFSSITTVQVAEDGYVLGSITDGITYVSGNSGSGTAATIVKSPYVMGSFAAESTATFNIGDGNLPNGISCIYWNNSSRTYRQLVLTPPIPKTNTKVLTLKFRTVWGR